MKLVPEIYCSDIQNTKKFYVETLGMAVKYERNEEKFAYLTKDGSDIMVEEVYPKNRQWITDKLDYPFGRGINFQWPVTNIDELYKRVKSFDPECIFLNIEKKMYPCGTEKIFQQQFIVQDPDGYLIRFCEELKG